MTVVWVPRASAWTLSGGHYASFDARAMVIQSATEEQCTHGNQGRPKADHPGSTLRWFDKASRSGKILPIMTPEAYTLSHIQSRSEIHGVDPILLLYPFSLCNNF